MIFKRLRRYPSIDTIRNLYGAIVAQARLPSFYVRYGVPDTVEGRFDMIVLHLFLLLRRMRQDERTGGLAGQLIEAFCRDLDHNLREMGIGDLAVPRRMQGYLEAFYGRSDAYGSALAAGDHAAAVRALARNVFGVAEPADGARLLAAYMFEAARVLEAAPASALTQGRVAFPDPEATVRHD